jgi:hypothetical protein
LEAVIANLDKIMMAKRSKCWYVYLFIVCILTWLFFIYLAQTSRRMVNNRAPRASMISDPSIYTSSDNSSGYEPSFASQ